MQSQLDNRRREDLLAGESLSEVTGKVNSGFLRSVRHRQQEQEKSHLNNIKIDRTTASAFENHEKNWKETQISMLESMNRKQKTFMKGEKFRQLLIQDKRDKNKIKSQQSKNIGDQYKEWQKQVEIEQRKKLNRVQKRLEDVERERIR